MAEQKRIVRDFGFEPEQSPHHFAVIQQQRSGNVRVEERFAWDEEGDDAPGPEEKAALDGYRWGRIAEHVQTTFNQRLRRTGLRAARWKARETLLAPDFGRELTLLAWAVEDADPSVIPNMLSNWSGFAPEERWWLYTTVNATSGHPAHGKDKGWRKAIKIAFTENPTFDVSPAAFLSDQLPLDDKPKPRRRKPRRETPEGQLSLIDMKEEKP